jgi:Peptidase family C69
MVQLLLLLLTTLCTCASSNTIRKGRPEYTSPDEFGNDRCTAIAVGKAATADGSTMTTYNADCAECDWRVNKVEAQDWPEGSMRPIYLLSGAYPRQVRSDRGYTWSPENLEDMPQKAEWEKMRGEIIGHIPQVAHTYAILEGLYGIMNEFQVAIGESTCASKLWAAPKGPTGKGAKQMTIIFSTCLSFESHLLLFQTIHSQFLIFLNVL